MRLFDYIDKALQEDEKRESYLSRSPSVWPSEASAVLEMEDTAPIVGKCHRAAYFRMTGEPIWSPTDAIGLRRFRTGRAMENDVIELAKLAGILVACGVRAYAKDLQMSYELDLVVIDPETKIPYIVENKSIYGYWATKTVFKDKEPKREAIMQISMYLNEIRTGAKLKQIIADCLKKQQELTRELADLEERSQSDPALLPQVRKLRSKLDRYRMVVDQGNLDAVADDVAVRGKLAYESRDECETGEFDVELDYDPVFGCTYPVIDGQLKKLFTVESIYDRYKTLQGYWNRAIDEAERRLQINKDTLPEEEYWEKIAQEIRKLPAGFLPPAEYQWKYDKARATDLGNRGLIGKTRFEKWKKNPKSEHLGDWQCMYCPYKQKCVGMEYPDMRHLLLDLKEQAA